MTITATPGNGYGVATIEINGEPLPKDEFDSDSHQFAIQVDSDTTVNVGFRQKYAITFYLKQEGLNGNFTIYANITSGYEKLKQQSFTTPSSDFAGILGADLCIEITQITAPSGSATPNYLYITTGNNEEVILDWVQLISNQGTLEIPADYVTSVGFTLVATNTEPSTTTTN